MSSDDDKPSTIASRIAAITPLMHSDKPEDQALYAELLPRVKELQKDAADEAKGLATFGFEEPGYYVRHRGMSFRDAALAAARARAARRAKERERE